MLRDGFKLPYPIKVFLFSGKAGSGKTSASSMFAERLKSHGVNCIRVSFAAPIKSLAEQVFGWDGDKTEYYLPDGKLDPARGRGMLIAIGMFGRSLDEDVWVDLALRKIAWSCLSVREELQEPLHCVVIDDLRMLNEIERVRAVLGPNAVLVRVARPGVTSNDTPTETQLDNYPGWDVAILNDKGVSELESVVTALADKHFGEQYAANQK